MRADRRRVLWMVSVLDNICETFITSEPEFWLLAGLTDASYETGGSVAYRRVVDSFVAAGLRNTLVERLRLGVNNILAEMIHDDHPSLRPVRGNRGRGTTRPDL